MRTKSKAILTSNPHQAHHSYDAEALYDLGFFGAFNLPTILKKSCLRFLHRASILPSSAAFFASSCFRRSTFFLFVTLELRFLESVDLQNQLLDLLFSSGSRMTARFAISDSDAEGIRFRGFKANGKAASSAFGMRSGPKTAGVRTIFL